METPTVLMLSPADHGRVLSREEFETAHYAPGARYELIEGKLYVSPAPNPSHESLVKWVEKKFEAYILMHPEIMNRVSSHGPVFVPGDEDETAPEPDLAAYEDYPFHIPRRQWVCRQIHPNLVVVVISEVDPKKDLRRNVALYLQVPSILEYWVLDPRTEGDPDLLVYRRRGQGWQRRIRIAGGGTYTTKLLPGFSLVLDASDA